MTTIESLSNEVLDQMIRLTTVNLAFKHPQPLPILSILSKRFHALVEPILYSRYDEAPSGNRNSTALFLKRALARSDLAARVKIYRGLARDSNNYEDVTCFSATDWSQ
jgi:hypothetical protein